MSEESALAYHRRLAYKAVQYAAALADAHRDPVTRRATQALHPHVQHAECAATLHRLEQQAFDLISAIKRAHPSSDNV